MVYILKKKTNNHILNVHFIVTVKCIAQRTLEWQALENQWFMIQQTWEVHFIALKIFLFCNHAFVRHLKDKMEELKLAKSRFFSEVNYKRGITNDMENYNELLPCVAMCTNLNEIHIFTHSHP